MGQTGTRKKKAKTLKEELAELLNEEDYRRRMLRAVVEKAIDGDMKAFEAVREILNEKNGEEDPALTIRLGPGVEELAK